MNFKRLCVFVLVSMLCVLCFDACDQGNAQEQTTRDGKVTYTVTVVDANGAPIAGVAIQFCDDNGCRMPVATNADGVVTLTDLESNFHVTIASVPEGFAADATEYYFGGAFELTVTLNAAE